MSRTNKTARAIIFKDDSLLMIERHNNGQHYFVLPGGHVDENETYEQAAIREVAEETGLTVAVDKILYTSIDGFGNDQRLFLCTYQGGDPQLPQDSIEAKVQNSGQPQQWAPGWFTFHALAGQTVYPAGLLKYLQEDRASGYHHNPYKILEPRV